MHTAVGRRAEVRGRKASERIKAPLAHGAQATEPTQWVCGGANRESGTVSGCGNVAAPKMSRAGEVHGSSGWMEAESLHAELCERQRREQTAGLHHALPHKLLPRGLCRSGQALRKLITQRYGRCGGHHVGRSETRQRGRAHGRRLRVHPRAVLQAHAWAQPRRAAPARLPGDGEGAAAGESRNARRSALPAQATCPPAPAATAAPGTRARPWRRTPRWSARLVHPLRRPHMRSAGRKRASLAGDHTIITCDVVAKSPGLAVVAEREAKNTARHRFARYSPRLRAHGLGACDLPGWRVAGSLRDEIARGAPPVARGEPLAAGRLSARANTGDGGASCGPRDAGAD
jgi:hypothetical protein